jgi:FkbM family methyltransferase
MIKQLIKGVLSEFGYKIQRFETAQESAFEAQKKILSNVESPTIFDVGANIGQTIDIYRNLFPASKIFAFEPFKESFDKARSKYSEDGNTQVFKLALGSTNGSQTFHVNPSSPTNSLLATDESGSRVWGQGLLETKEIVRVDVIRLDDFLKMKDIERIDLMKLDVQGAEYLVIEGAANTLRVNNINVIYTEIITMPTYVGQRSFDEILKIFYDQNFHLYNIYNLSTIDGWLRQVDAIFVNKLYETTKPLPADAGRFPL